MSAAQSLCDRGIALSCERRAEPRRRLVLAACVLASGMDYVDGSVINVGLPAIGRDLGAHAAGLQWAVNGYLLPLSALLLTGGALGDRFGRRRLLIFGIAAFALGSAGCALAPTLPWLIAARAVQGLSAALMLPNSLAVLGGTFEGASRSRAIGVWAAAGAVAAAIGPVLGGGLIDRVGWRAIFLINLPFAGLALALALYAIGRDPPRKRQGRLDLVGAALISLALAALTWGLTEGSGAAGWGATALAAVAAGLALAAGFALAERRLGDAAMTPPALFASRPFVALNLLTLLLYGVLAGVLLLLPYLLIKALGWRATEAGAALLPFSAIMGLVSPAAGALAGRIGARWPLVAGAALVALGCAWLGLVDPRAGYAGFVLPAVSAIALGMALAAAPLTTAVLSAVDPGHTGAASGFNSAVAQLGGVVAVALLGSVLGRPRTGLAPAFQASALIGAAVAMLAGFVIAAFYSSPRDEGGAAPG